jgi:sugar O-acyltransferase (sialic acid O-acetyltransferase NeuD family)
MLSPEHIQVIEGLTREMLTVPSSSVQFVMFGQSARFGDYLDIIASCGNFLKKVVVNVADPAPDGRKNFEARLREANAHLARLHHGQPIELEHIDDFRPGTTERYVIGFRGPQVRALQVMLSDRYNIKFDNLIHPSAAISAFGSRGEGIIVSAGVVVASGVTLGDFCMLNRNSSIGHDATIGPYTDVGPGANLASGVVLGAGAAVGIGATIIENVRIGDGAFVAAGAVVIRDVDPGTMVAGNPASFKNVSKRSTR